VAVFGYIKLNFYLEVSPNALVTVSMAAPSELLKSCEKK
jgi:hypothetical protein